MITRMTLINACDPKVKQQLLSMEEENTRLRLQVCHAVYLVDLSWFLPVIVTSPTRPAPLSANSVERCCESAHDFVQAATVSPHTSQLRVLRTYCLQLEEEEEAERRAVEQQRLVLPRIAGSPSIIL